MWNYVKKLRERDRRTVKRLLEEKEIYWDNFFEKFLYREDGTELTGLVMQKKYRDKTDENYHEGEVWHNHKNTCSLCGVLYLKTVKGCGIELRHKNKISYIEPKTYDLLIFPGFLDHKPLISKTKKRVSLQFEIFTQPE